MLHAEKIVVEVAMEKLLTSFGKELHLDEVVLDAYLFKGILSFFKAFLRDSYPF